MAARKITAPNSKVRAFHVERVCEMYRRYSSGLEFDEGDEDVGVCVLSCEGSEVPMEGDVSLVMSMVDGNDFGRPAP
jgi:hypothetical protein